MTRPAVALFASALAVAAAACAPLRSPGSPVMQPPPSASPDPRIDAASRALSDQYQQRLLAALTAALAAGGPAGAIDTCVVEAPRIAADLSASSGATVRRTALRTRNPLAAPDATERVILEALRAAPLGADGKPAERSGYAGDGADRHYRYLRAIPTGPMCLTCHGPKIDPGLAATIARRYPQDTATGFAPGELRGAFSLRWTQDALDKMPR